MIKRLSVLLKKNKSVLFSGDWGFANILDLPPKEYPGIVILHFPNEVSTSFIANEAKKIISKIPLRKFKRALIIVEPGRLRIRKED